MVYSTTSVYFSVINTMVGLLRRTRLALVPCHRIRQVDPDNPRTSVWT